MVDIDDDDDARIPCQFCEKCYSIKTIESHQVCIRISFLCKFSLTKILCLFRILRKNVEGNNNNNNLHLYR